MPQADLDRTSGPACTTRLRTDDSRVLLDTHSSPAPHFLPGNPLPYLAPSATHQPELLLLAWMLTILHTLVTGILHYFNCQRPPYHLHPLSLTNRPTGFTFNSATRFDT